MSKIVDVYHLAADVSFWEAHNDEGFFVAKVQVVGEPGQLPVVLAHAQRKGRTPAMAIALALEATGQELAKVERAHRRWQEGEDLPVDRKP